MENVLTRIIGNQPIGQSANTGMAIYQSFVAGSGFNYQVGIRQADELYIVECFAEGVACLFLSRIIVLWGKNKQLIADIQVPYGTHYTREKAKELTKNELCKFVYQGCVNDGIPCNREDINSQVNELLDKCYFAESWKAALSWAVSKGIIKR